jgi:hypothetical protein
MRPGVSAGALCSKAGIRLLPMIGQQTTVKERICLVTGPETTIEQIVRVDQDSPHQMTKDQLDLCSSECFTIRSMTASWSQTTGKVSSTASTVNF